MTSSALTVQAITMRERLSNTGDAITSHWRLWLGVVIGFPILYFASMMAALLIRFQAWPNYVRVHDWFGSVVEIVRSTPSWRDMFPIIKEEWLFEIGHMNYDYGTGISEWSLNVIPSKVLVVVVLGVCIATVLALLKSQPSSCSLATKRGAGTVGGVGAGLVAMTSVTLSWVVCCATPSWVVGLAILGLGVSTSLWLEQFGAWIEYVGFAFLLVSLWVLAAKAEAKGDERAEERKSVTPSATPVHPSTVVGAPQ